MSNLSPTPGSLHAVPSNNSNESSRGKRGVPGSSSSIIRPQASSPQPSEDSKIRATRTLHDGHQSVAGTKSTRTRITADVRQSPTLHDDTYPADSNCPPALGRYQILERIGSGAMGVVYSAYDPSLQRRVAIKLMRRSDSNRNLARFIQEAQLMARLSHPNVVQVFEAGQNQDRAFLAMELIEGLTLGDWLQRKPRTLQQILDVFVQIGNGLHAAHCAGVIHRDFKPDNIFVGHDGRARVGDFGVARLADHSQETNQGKATDSLLLPKMTAHGEIIGTPAYMSPEQLLGQAIDARSDQFAFCVALYESIYRKRPFAAQSPEGLAALLLDQKQLHVVFPHKQDPSWIRSALRKGLSLTPSARFDSMLPLLAELQRKPKARWPILLGASALTLITWLAVDRSSQIDASLCPEDLSILKGIWDEPMQTKVQESILGSEIPYRDTLASHIEERLNNYASKIIDEQQDSCRATHVIHNQSERKLDRRQHCIDDRILSFRNLVFQLQNPAISESDNIEQSLEALPDPQYCGRSEFTSGSWAPPASRAVTLQIKTIRDQLSELFALPNQAAIEKAQRLIQEAEKTEFPPLIAESWFTLGRIYHQAHKLDNAVEAFLQAVDHAEASGHDELTWRGWIDLTKIANSERINLVEAERWLRRSEALLKRLGKPDQMTADVLDERGKLAIHRGETEKALRAFRESLELLNRCGAPVLRVMETNLHIASAHHMLGDYKLSKQLNLSTLQAFKKLPEGVRPKPKQVARTHMAIAASYSMNSEYDLAIESYQTALGFLDPLPSKDYGLLAHIQLELANISFFTNDCKSAYRHTNKSLELAEKSRSKRGPISVRNYQLIASCHWRDKQLHLAREVYLKSLKILERLENSDTFDYWQALTNIGNLELELRNVAAAKNYLSKSVMIAESSEGLHGWQLRQSQKDYANALFQDSNSRQATVILEQVLENLLDENDLKTKEVEIAAIEWQLSRVYLGSKFNMHRAFELAQRARNRLSSMESRDQSTAQDIDQWITTNFTHILPGEKNETNDQTGKPIGHPLQ